jgi:subtilase family serine protease
MLMKPARILAIAVSVAMLIIASAHATRLDSAAVDRPSSRTASIVRIPGHVLGALAKATRIKSAPHAGDSPITLTLTLNRDDQAGFERYLHEIYDPHSKNFHHFLTQPEIAARFGPSQTRYDAVLAYLKDRGFTLVEGSANRMTITVRGTRAMAQRSFDTRIGDYRIGKISFYANAANPALPADLAPDVQSIEGLANLARPRSTTKAIKWVIGTAICSLDFDDRPPCAPGEHACYLAIKPTNCPFCSSNAMQPYTRSYCLAAVKNAAQNNGPLNI